MKLNDYLNKLPPPQRERMMGRLEGMTMAIRIARNRASDMTSVSADNPVAQTRENEAQTIASMIRLMQVNIGNGTMPFGDLSDEEIDEILRIY